MSIQGEIDRINNNVSDALAATAEMGASVPETANSNDLGRLIRSIPQSGGGTSINVTAEVGQTIVVKAVDENGKPTAWESAEYQPRTHWTGVGEILPETTIAIDSESGEATYAETIGLTVGKNYTVKWNGTEYNCTAQDYSAPNSEGIMVSLGVVLGNLDLMMGGEGTGEPFVILEAIPDFAAELGSPVSILAVDGSATVTLSIAGAVCHPIPSEYVPYALPYYINLIVMYSDDGSIESAGCNETVSQLEDIYRSGRTLVLRFKTKENLSDGQGNPITYIYEYRWQLAISASTSLRPGTIFQFANPCVEKNSGGAYVTSVITLEPNEEGTYTVRGVFLN